MRRKQLLVTAGAYPTEINSSHLTDLTRTLSFLFFSSMWKVETSILHDTGLDLVLCQEVGARKSISVELNETNFKHVTTVFWRS